LTVVPKARLDQLELVEVRAHDLDPAVRAGGTLKGVSGGALSAVQATSPMPAATSRARSSATPGLDTRRARRRRPSPTARTAPRDAARGELRARRLGLRDPRLVAVATAVLGG
jgi:hypothetical protein